MMLYNFLRYSCAMPEVLEVACPEMGGGWNWWVIRMRKSHPSKPKQALHAASGMDPTSKMIIVVDEDIDPKDPDMVMWAMSFAMQPHQDVEISTGRSPLLDPSAHSLMRGREERSYPGRRPRCPRSISSNLGTVIRWGFGMMKTTASPRKSRRGSIFNTKK
jgi:hypothetical protein